MPDSLSPKLAELLRRDRRYKPEAYAFVYQALGYAHQVLGMGAVKPNDPAPGEHESGPSEGEQHLTGQQLCEAIRLFALEQYGYMARCVLNSWGVRTTSDFGEIVFSLIRIGEMRKSKDDRREDFDGVFDFETGLEGSFRIQAPESK
jgi:uncharacterized repeat protein (TIGR04138 family)